MRIILHSDQISNTKKHSWYYRWVSTASVPVRAPVQAQTNLWFSRKSAGKVPETVRTYGKRVGSFLAVAQPNCNIFCWNFFYMLVIVRGITFTLVDVRLSRVFSRKPPIRLKMDFDKNSCSKVFFEFPPTVTWNVVILTYVVADILLYPKSSGSAQTVEYSWRTSSQSEPFKKCRRTFLPTQ